MFKRSTSVDEYSNLHTLKHRLQCLAMDMGKHFAQRAGGGGASDETGTTMATPTHTQLPPPPPPPLPPTERTGTKRVRHTKEGTEDGWGGADGVRNLKARLDHMVASLSDGFENLKQLLDNM